VFLPLLFINVATTDITSSNWSGREKIVIDFGNVC
jgi:hypothetical protein